MPAGASLLFTTSRARRAPKAPVGGVANRGQAHRRWWCRRRPVPNRAGTTRTRCGAPTRPDRRARSPTGTTPRETVSCDAARTAANTRRGQRSMRHAGTGANARNARSGTVDGRAPTARCRTAPATARVRQKRQGPSRGGEASGQRHAVHRADRDAIGPRPEILASAAPKLRAPRRGVDIPPPPGDVEIVPERPERTETRAARANVGNAVVESRAMAATSGRTARTR